MKNSSNFVRIFLSLSRYCDLVLILNFSVISSYRNEFQTTSLNRSKVFDFWIHISELIQEDVSSWIQKDKYCFVSLEFDWRNFQIEFELCWWSKMSRSFQNFIIIWMNWSWLNDQSLSFYNSMMSLSFLWDLWYLITKYESWNWFTQMKKSQSLNEFIDYMSDRFFILIWDSSC